MRSADRSLAPWMLVGAVACVPLACSDEGAGDGPATTTTTGTAGAGGAGAGGGSAGAGGLGGGGSGQGGQVVVYPALPDDQFASSHYEVVVWQDGQSHPSYVYQSDNDFDPAAWSRPLMSDANHWTSFSFEGSVLVEVTMLEGEAPSAATIRPQARQIAETIDGSRVSFTLDEPANVHVDIDGRDAHPLFVFANPLETDVPDPDDPNVIYFGPGVHDVGETHDALSDGAVVYIAGGAYVKGLLEGEINADPITIRGRGILSGIDYAHVSGPGTWTNHLIELPGSSLQTDLRIEGVTLTDGPKACIITRGKTSIDNVKLLGWHHNTDGITVGPDSTVTNSFFKVNDDVIKLYASGMTVSHNVIWLQPTGAAFQLSWNLSQDVTGSSVSDIDVIRLDRDQGPPSETGYNNAIVGCRNLSGATTSQLVFDQIRMEQSPYQLFGIRIEDTMPGFDAGLGSVEELIFRSWSVPAPPLALSVFDGNGTQTGEIKNVTFDDVVIDGVTLSESNAASYLIRQGLTSGFQYP
ncbi:MAG: hypothetical protein JRI23_08255 [Deltaproteobacteria bacterium]|jgi:hypothetical protein|nr:hypothetical protein [Deltaproteobacteria bacterium]MBW2531605.1 hypothetical protein [Deltaproteobacteria bacterium]